MNDVASKALDSRLLAEFDGLTCAVAGREGPDGAEISTRENCFT